MGAQLLVDAGPRLITRRVSGPTSPSRYRHPGDVLRLITSGVILVSALVIAALMPERLLGSRAATVQGWSPTPSPASCTGLVQAVAIAAVVAVVVALMRRRRFRLLGTLAGGAVFAGPGWRAPDGAPPGSPDGTEHQSAHVILVSNGRYDLTGPQAFGSPRRLDGGTSGIVTAELRSSRDLARFIQMETTMGRASRFRGWITSTDTRFEVRSSAPVEIGIDGEALVLDAPATFLTMRDPSLSG